LVHKAGAVDVGELGPAVVLVSEGGTRPGTRVLDPATGGQRRRGGHFEAEGGHGKEVKAGPGGHGAVSVVGEVLEDGVGHGLRRLEVAG